VIKSLYALPLIGCLFFTSCTTTPLIPESKNTAPQLKIPLEHWTLQGAVAARYEQRALTASIYWAQQHKEQYQLRLIGALGSNSVWITKQGNQVTYRDGNKQRTTTNPSQCLATETGLHLPVEYLTYWIQGLPAQAPIEATEYDEHHHRTLLKQSGYTIHYLHYTTVNGIALPDKITVTKHQFMMKLVIKKWDLNLKA
jgi:outer membrane lipoprotein LolB